GVIKGLRNLVPEYMAMGERGMADMTEMEMPLPDNTEPMMTGQGQYGSVEMGGMFSMLKVRKDLEPGVYADPGWYEHPPGTVAYEFKGKLAEPERSSDSGQPAMKLAHAPKTVTEVKIRKPRKHSGM
ncbi:MAG: copper oxidase, partial [Burkholderiaceae bacterium]